MLLAKVFNNPEYVKTDSKAAERFIMFKHNVTSHKSRSVEGINNFQVRAAVSELSSLFPVVKPSAPNPLCQWSIHQHPHGAQSSQSGQSQLQ